MNSIVENENNLKVKCFFVYGTLKPGQLGYPIIRDLVDEDKTTKASIQGYRLWTHDGLPFLRPDKENIHSLVNGELLYPKPGASIELCTRINHFENSDLYMHKNLSVQTESENTTAVVYIAKGGTNRHDWEQLMFSSWEISNDSVLIGAIPELFKLFCPIIQKRERLAGGMNEYWQNMLPLQGNYLSLCSVLERVALFRYNCYSDTDSPGPTQRINKMDHDNDFISAVLNSNPPPLDNIWRANQNSSYSVWEDIGHKILSKPCQTWYAVRSNLNHQGKDAGFRSFDILYAASAGLFDTLVEFLSTTIPLLSEEWLLIGFNSKSDRLCPLLKKKLKEQYDF